jgi:tetratricopeptide (TPR) repeat protein
MDSAALKRLLIRKHSVWERGLAHYHAGRFADAIAHISRAIQDVSYDAHYYYVRGLAYKAANQPARAIKDFEKALSIRNGSLKVSQAEVIQQMRIVKKEHPLRTSKLLSEQVLTFIFIVIISILSAVVIAMVIGLLDRENFISFKTGLIGIISGILGTGGATLVKTLLKNSKPPIRGLGAMLVSIFSFIIVVGPLYLSGLAKFQREEFLFPMLCGYFAGLLIGLAAINDKEVKSWLDETLLFFSMYRK